MDGSPTRASRSDRLLRALVWVGDPDLARSLRAVPESELRQQPAVIRTALQALRRKRDPAGYVTQPQYRPALTVAAGVVSEACMDSVISALGDSSDDPDRDQLLAAIDGLGDRFPSSMVALTLAYVAATEMPAADVCDQILESDERFAVPAP